ncbi:mannitol dehydrogenase family protein [Paenarthrobacter sp. NPDC058233]|uniref:mannitol dehydrogenase family protein n=1 Tax=Paenarthrobacter sp. NPDC058233 TaxID=3346394 RepID=UPI0036DCB0DF
MANRPLALDRSALNPGIVHLGLGAFARAHTAVFTEKAMELSGESGWGIIGITQRSDTVVQQLAPQDGLFTVAERGQAAAPLHVVSSVLEAVSGRDNPVLVVKRLALPSVAVITLTITEKGYRIDPQTGSLNFEDHQIQSDLAGNPPQTAIGQIVRGLQERCRLGVGPVTVVSCDNFPGNGELTERLVNAFAAALPAAEASPLMDWMDRNVTFPNTMVDRMVPATTPGDIAAVERELDLRDEAAVVAEPFMQWVIEDKFAGPRPRWEDAGAVFSNDVAAWEAAKLRLLNASHSLLAYLGLAASKKTIADAIAVESFRAASERMMFQDVLPTLHLPERLDGETYCKQVLARFANPALGHTTRKVASDGSQKVGLRLLTTVRANLDAGRTPKWAALAVAAWMHHVATTAAGELNDPMAAELHAALPTNRSPASVVHALLGVRNIFDDRLATHAGFAALLEHWYAIIDEHGLEGLGNEILHG